MASALSETHLQNGVCMGKTNANQKLANGNGVLYGHLKKDIQFI